MVYLLTKHTPLGIASLFTLCPKDTSPTGFQSEVFGEFAFLAGILKTGALNVKSKSQREAWS